MACEQWCFLALSGPVPGRAAVEFKNGGCTWYSTCLRFVTYCIQLLFQFMSLFVNCKGSLRYVSWERSYLACMERADSSCSQQPLGEYRILQRTCTYDRIFFVCGATAPIGPRPPHCRSFEITQLDTHIPGRTPLNEWSARRRGRYLHNKHNRRTSMPLAGFEPAIPAIKWLQTYALDRTVTGIGAEKFITGNFDVDINNKVFKEICWQTVIIWIIFYRKFYNFEQ
jgi:hypothetical protein